MHWKNGVVLSPARSRCVHTGSGDQHSILFPSKSTSVIVGTLFCHICNMCCLKGRAARVSAARTEKGSIDGEGVLFSGIQILICANKWDKIESLPAPSKAVLAKALRCVAHAHGCHLIYTTSTPTSSGSTNQKTRELLQKKLRTLLTHMMFLGFERKLCAILLDCIDLQDILACCVIGHALGTVLKLEGMLHCWISKRGQGELFMQFEYISCRACCSPYSSRGGV